MRGDLDLVVTSDPIDEGSLAYLPLFGYEAQLAMAMDHPLAEKEWIEAEDLVDETLIAYPIDRSRLDIFTLFLDPAAVNPARIRTAELTTMMVQLVASGRGVCCLPNWALHEYIEREYVVARSLGEEGVWPNLYAAVRAEQRDAPYVAAFVALAKETCSRIWSESCPQTTSWRRLPAARRRKRRRDRVASQLWATVPAV